MMSKLNLSEARRSYCRAFVLRKSRGIRRKEGDSHLRVFGGKDMPSQAYKTKRNRASPGITLDPNSKVEFFRWAGVSLNTRASSEKVLNRMRRFAVIEEKSRREVGTIDSKNLRHYEENFSDLQSQEDSKHVPRGAQIAIANISSKLMNDWGLFKKDMATLLGLDFDASGQEYVENLLNGTCSFSGRDTRYRMAQLIQIREILFALFKNHEVENEWLREKQSMLNDKTPMDLLLEGPMKNLVLVREFVETVAGR